MDITMIGLQNAGKTSLLRVLAVSVYRKLSALWRFRPDTVQQGGEFTIEYVRRPAKMTEPSN